MIVIYLKVQFQKLIPHNQYTFNNEGILKNG